MDRNSCQDSIRFSLSDDTGDLRFKSFDIVNAPECRSMLETLRNYILSRPLVEIDLRRIQQLDCPGNGQCMDEVVEEIKEAQMLFTPSGGG